MHAEPRRIYGGRRATSGLIPPLHTRPSPPAHSAHPQPHLQPQCAPLPMGDGMGGDGGKRRLRGVSTVCVFLAATGLPLFPPPSSTPRPRKPPRTGAPGRQKSMYGWSPPNEASRGSRALISQNLPFGGSVYLRPLFDSAQARGDSGCPYQTPDDWRRTGGGPVATARAASKPGPVRFAEKGSTSRTNAPESILRNLA